MSGMSLDDLGELQKQVMEIVWELEQATVHQVRKALGRKKLPAYTTVLSIMQKLEKAGWLNHRSEGRAYIYFPRQSRQNVGRKSLRQFVNRVFGGDALVMLEHLLDDEQLSVSDLAEFRRLIDKRKKELRDGRR